jgi:cyclopropane fatty-acyl-phospholipid synthase-like methyltransferase
VGLEEFPGAGQTLYQRLVHHPNLERIFQEAMSALSRQANACLLEAYDFRRFSHLVDAGGGDGTNAIALARRFPHLKVTVFDSPSVCQLAQRKIEAAGLSARVFTWAGDFLQDPFPPGIDAVLYAHILTIWSAERNRALLKKTYAALPAGGAVLIFNMLGNDEETGPLSTALGSPYFLAIATGEGMLHPGKDYELWLKEAGFSHLERFSALPLNHGLLVGSK